jgi:hypothetical protein
MVSLSKNFGFFFHKGVKSVGQKPNFRWTTITQQAKLEDACADTVTDY